MARIGAMCERTSFESESRANLNIYLAANGLELDLSTPDHVNWNSTSNSHPRQWVKQQKVHNLSFIILYESFEAAMSTIGASAAIQARGQLECNRTVAYFAFTTTFIVGEGLAGLVFPPLSESLGRKRLFVLSSGFFCLFTGLTTIPSIPVIAVMRLLAGFVGGIPPSISPACLEDIFSRQQQVWAIFAWATASNVGMIVGPIASGYLVDVLGWSWVFYLATIYSFMIFIFAMSFKESRPDILLSRAIQTLHKDTGLTHLRMLNLEHHPTWHSLITETLARPMRLLCTEPIIIVASLLNSMAFGLIYALTEALPLVYTAFGLSVANSSLAFIPVLIGVLLSTLFRIFDHYRLARLRKRERPQTPEHKVASLLISAPMLLFGLWTFSWTIPPVGVQLSYLFSMAALIPIGLATNDFDAVIAGYLVDCYGEYAASAFAAVTWTRAIVSIVFSLATDAMFRKLGNNTASSVIGVGGVFVCFGAVELWYSGSFLRRKSKFARRDDLSTDV